MRKARLKLEAAATYHVMSRIVDRQLLIGEREKAYLRHIMRRLEVFTGCEVKTYALMDNHFHLLLHVPLKKEVSDTEVISRARVLYGKKKFSGIEEQFRRWEEQGQEYLVQEQINNFRVRMYDLSEFMKTFKQRFSIFYNSTHARRGTLWEERYKSVLVEENQHAQLVTAAYIDLNPVRAGIVGAPEDYRWSGYGEAVAVAGSASRGISHLFINEDVTLCKQDALMRYRKFIYYRGECRFDGLTGAMARPGFSKDMVDLVLEKGGRLSLPDILRCKVRYFSDGFIIGSRGFVNKMFREHALYFTDKKRNRGAKIMKYGEWGGLCAARELQVGVISIPDDG
jgi:putative transposase